MLGRDMRLSRRAQYALCGVFDLAFNGAGEPVRVAQIGERQGIPYRFLEQIFQDLRRAELVTGKRGPGGGYVLARRAEEISLRQVVEAVDGPLVAPAAEEVEGWMPSAHRPDFLFGQVASRVGHALEGVSVSDVCREAVRRSVDRELPDGLDYQI